MDPIAINHEDSSSKQVFLKEPLEKSLVVRWSVTAWREI